MFIKTTDETLINLDTIASITIKDTSIIAKARDTTYNENNRPYTATYTLGYYSNIDTARRAKQELETSIALKKSLHEMYDPYYDAPEDV